MCQRKPTSPPHECGYCGLPLADVAYDSEHVVARQLFPAPRPSDLDRIVLKSCRACNEAVKHDEDLFRVTFLVSDVPLSGVRSALFEKVRAAAQKDSGLMARVHRQFRVARPDFSESEADAARPYLFHDEAASSRVLRKWVQGLQWLGEHQRFPEPPTLEFAFARTREEMLAFHEHAAKHGRGCWPSVFESWTSRDPRNAWRQRWTFALWETYFFVVAVNQPFPGRPIPVSFSEQHDIHRALPLDAAQRYIIAPRTDMAALCRSLSRKAFSVTPPQCGPFRFA